MQNSNIIGDIKVSLDNYDNLKISWLADDGLHNTIPNEIRMGIDEALDLIDEIQEVVWVKDFYKDYETNA